MLSPNFIGRNQFWRNPHSFSYITVFWVRSFRKWRRVKRPLENLNASPGGPNNRPLVPPHFRSSVIHCSHASPFICHPSMWRIVYSSGFGGQPSNKMRQNMSRPDCAWNKNSNQASVGLLQSLTYTQMPLVPHLCGFRHWSALI